MDATSESGAHLEESVEVVHEVMIRRWQRLREWMEAAREFRMWQERLRAALRQWEASKRDDGALLRGAPLAEAEGWLAEQETDLSQAEQSFIQASGSRERRRRQILTGAVAIVVLILTIALSAVFVQWQKAERQTRIAQDAKAEAERQATIAQQQEEAKRQTRIAQARRLAAQAQVAFEKYPQRNLLLALEALNVTLRETEPRVPAAEEVMRQALTKTGGIGLHGHKGSIISVAISPDNHWLVTGSSDGTARLWTLWLDELIELACRTAGRNLSGDEWDQYFPGEEYRKTCPDLPVHWSVSQEDVR